LYWDFVSTVLSLDAGQPNRYAANHKLPSLVLGKNFSQIIPLGIYNVSPSEPCGPLRLVGGAVA
jgi:hypothetical protein